MPKKKVTKEQIEKAIPEKKSIWCKLWYMPDGTPSLTRIIMAVTFIFAIGTGLAGLIGSLFSWTIPDQVYDYSFKLSGGGLLQYGLTKLKDSVDQRVRE